MSSRDEETGHLAFKDPNKGRPLRRSERSEDPRTEPVVLLRFYDDDHGPCGTLRATKGVTTIAVPVGAEEMTVDLVLPEPGGLAGADVWIVLTEDRHASVEPLPFSTEKAAVQAARAAAGENARHPEDIDWHADLTHAMRKDGWVLYVPYGTEGDCVRVVKRAMDGPA